MSGIIVRERVDFYNSLESSKYQDVRGAVRGRDKKPTQETQEIGKAIIVEARKEPAIAISEEKTERSVSKSQKGGSEPDIGKDKVLKVVQQRLPQKSASKPPVLTPSDVHRIAELKSQIGKWINGWDDFLTFLGVLVFCADIILTCGFFCAVSAASAAAVKWWLMATVWFLPRQGLIGGGLLLLSIITIEIIEAVNNKKIASIMNKSQQKIA